MRRPSQALTLRRFWPCLRSGSTFGQQGTLRWPGTSPAVQLGAGLTRHIVCSLARRPVARPPLKHVPAHNCRRQPPTSAILPSTVVASHHIVPADGSRQGVAGKEVSRTVSRGERHQWKGAGNGRIRILVGNRPANTARRTVDWGLPEWAALKPELDWFPCGGRVCETLGRKVCRWQPAVDGGDRKGRGLGRG